MYDEEAIRGALLELELGRQEGALSEADDAQAEERLLERLEEALQRRQSADRGGKR